MSLLLLLSAPALIVNRSGTSVVPLGDNVYTAEKTAGTFAWDSDAVGTVGYAGDFYLRLKQLTGGTGFYAGMNTDPLTDSSYTSIDYALVFTGSAWLVSESGATVGSSFGSASDYGWIWRSGTTLGYGHGATLAAAMAAPDRTLTTSATLYFDSSLVQLGDKIEIAIDDSIPIILTADVGSYIITGTATGGPALTRKLPADVGSYAITGTATGLRIARRLALVPGAYTLSGTATALRTARKLAEAVGSYAITGTATGLRTARRLAGTVGNYSISGQTVALRRGYSMAVVPGSYAITGTATGLRTARRLTLLPGAYALTGAATGLRAARKLAEAIGSYALSGQSVTLTYAPVSGEVAVPGGYVLTGNTVALRVARRLTATRGIYTLTGQQATLVYTSIWVPSSPDTLPFPVDEPDEATWTPIVPPVPDFVNIEQATATWTDQMPTTWQ